MAISEASSNASLAFEALINNLGDQIEKLSTTVRQVKIQHEADLRRARNTSDKPPSLAANKPLNAVVLTASPGQRGGGMVFPLDGDPGSTGAQTGAGLVGPRSSPSSMPRITQAGGSDPNAAEGKSTDAQGGTAFFSEGSDFQNRQDANVCNLESVGDQVVKSTSLHLEIAEGWENDGTTSREVRVFGSERFTFDVFAKTSFRAVGEDKAKTFTDGTNPLQFLVVEPTSTFSLVWSLIEMFLLMFDLVAIPLSVYDLEETPGSLAMKYLSVSFWTSDVLVSFFKGYVNPGGEIEVKLSKVIKHYIKTRLIYDLALLSIEWINLSLEDLLNGSDFAESGRLLRFLRFSRLLKVGKMRRLVDQFLQRIHSNVVLTMVGITKVMLMVMVVIHMISCGWYFVCNAFDNDAGVVSWTDDLKDSSFLYRYFTSASWALTLFGFGDIEVFAVNARERVYSVISTAIGLLASCWMISSFVILMTRLQALQKTQREQEEMLRDFLGKHNVSWALRNRIWMFLQKTRLQPKKNVQESHVELVKQLPKPVTLELRAEVFIPVLTVHPFFCTYAVSQADKYAMHHVVEAHALQEIALESEHELFADRMECTKMYFVTLGSVVYHSAEMARLQNEQQELGKKRLSQGGRISARGDRPSLRLVDGPMHAMQALEDGSVGTVVGVSEWLCEPALWLKWNHTGWANAISHTELVTLDVFVFQQVMQGLNEATKYARLFLAYANRNKKHLNDVWYDLQSLKSMAQDIFEPPTVFEIERCQPAVNMTMGRNEWMPSDRRQWHRVWMSTFKDAHLLNRSALLSTMTADMKHDAILFYQTLFPPGVFNFKWSSDEERRHFDSRVLFMKRLVLALATHGVRFATEDNSSSTEAWPYPLASTLTHGGRILMTLTGVNWRDFMNLLFHGEADCHNWDEHGPPQPMYVRRAATHGTRVNDDSFLSEVKLKSTAAFDRCHLGMDLPLGGLGNPMPPHKSAQYFVGPSGVPFMNSAGGSILGLLSSSKSSEKVYNSQIQHGHLYVRWDDHSGRMMRAYSHSVRKQKTGASTTTNACAEPRLGRFDTGKSHDNLEKMEGAGAGDADQSGMPHDPDFQSEQVRTLCSLLLGIEGSAPMKDDIFGHAHSPDGQSKEVSAFGKRKWRDYRRGGQEVPSDLGGVRVDVSEANFRNFEQLMKRVNLTTPSRASPGPELERERDLFRSLLCASDEKVLRVLEEKLDFKTQRVSSASAAVTDAEI